MTRSHHGRRTRRTRHRHASHHRRRGDRYRRRGAMPRTHKRHGRHHRRQARHYRTRHRRARHYRRRHHRTRRRHSQRGGKNTPGAFNFSLTPNWRTRNTLTPTAVVNLARGALTGGENLINGWRGIPAEVSPMPSAQPGLESSPPLLVPPNLTALNQQAAAEVQSM